MNNPYQSPREAAKTVPESPPEPGNDVADSNQPSIFLYLGTSVAVWTIVLVAMVLIVLILRWFGVGQSS